MERIGVIGISWKRGGTQELARFTWPAEDRVQATVNLMEQADLREAFYLATCNRVEVAFVRDGKTPAEEYRSRIFTALTGAPPAPGEAERMLQEWTGEGAAEHLFMVVAGLDSAKLGENEIAGQVRKARDVAREAGTMGPRLEQVFDEAFKVAARVHQNTGIGTGRVSLAEIALERARVRLVRTPGSVALIGVSPMTERCGRALAEDGHKIVVANRTLSRAEEFASSIGAQGRSLADFSEQPDSVEVMILATGSQEPVLGRKTLERLAARTASGQAPLCIDLAVPPDVDPDAAQSAGVERVGLDEILKEADSSRESRQLELADCRCLVDEALIGLRRKMADRFLGPMIAALQRRYRQTALEGVDRLFRKELSTLGDKEREAVRRWAETLARRFAHLPTEGLKGIAFEEGLHAVEAFFARSDERLARELEASVLDPKNDRPTVGDNQS